MTEASADPPTIKNVGDLTISNPYADQAAMLMGWGWIVAATVLAILAASGRWRMGVALYLVAGLVGAVLYHWEFWTSPGDETLTQSGAIALSVGLLPMHAAGWLQSGLAGLAVGSLGRLIVTRCRRVRPPA